MFELSARTVRIALAIAAVWVAAAGTAWITIDPTVSLVGAKATGVSLADAAALEQADLSTEQGILEATSIWGMQRDGMDLVVKAPEALVEKKIIWSVAATVVRPKERYLLILDQGTKAITQVNEGEKLPDGTKLLRVSINTYTVSAEGGKKRTVETSF
jgi:hypothetical protein